MGDKKVAFHTLGCKVNQYETEAMEEIFKKNGYEVVDSEDKASIYVINTCTVTNMSDRKSRQIIRRAKRENKNSLVAVVGCYSQVSPEDIKKLKDVDVILGSNNKSEIYEMCQRALSTRTRIIKVQDLKKDEKFDDIGISQLEDMTRAYIKIQDGCNQYCSYCIIPYARGPIRSRDEESIYREVEDLANKGYKEIILTGIHLASYGKDLKDKEALLRLISNISNVDGIERIRFSSIEPRLITDKFMKTLVESKKVCDHFHLSLQSGSNTVLKRMNRKYTSQEYLDKVNIIRKYMPDAGITTDIIVGFPGETEKEFQESLDFVKKVNFSMLHVFKYSKREGTPAAKMKDQVNGNVKNERSKKLIELGDKLNNSFNKKFIGKRLEVLIEENSRDSEYLEGYTSNYIRVKLAYKEGAAGKILKVKLKEKGEGYLVGEL